MPKTRGTRKHAHRERVLLLFCLGAVVFTAATCQRSVSPRGSGPAVRPDRPPAALPRPLRPAPPASRQHAAEPGAITDAPRPAEPAAVVAIVIDDVGHSRAALEPFLALPYALTFAVLPRLEHSAELARLCRGAGREVLLHLPMQPQGEEDPGPGAVLASMRGQSLRETLQEDLATVPGAVGINNHMGSLATADGELMAEVMAWVREQQLFFLDSLTGRSVVAQTAAAAGVPTLARDIFLDGPSVPVEQREQQVRRLAEIAHQRGWAVGIGHAQPATAELLARLLPALEQEGVDIVPASQVLARANEQ